MDIDLEALERWKEKNRRERLQFVEDYANWLKKTPNKVWSEQQAELRKNLQKAANVISNSL